MRRTHLAVQAAIVLTMVSLISWPQFRPLHAQTVWRFSPAAVAQAQENDAQRFSSTSQERMRQPFGLGNAAYTSTVTTGSSPAVRSDIERSAPTRGGAGDDLGAKLNSVVGLAKSSLNAPIPYARVVLRNVKTGRVLERTMADSQGHFSFLGLYADEYLVELLGANGAVVASSALMALTRGEVRQTELLAPVTAMTMAAVVGNAYTSTLPQTTNVATSSGVTRTTTVMQAQLSTR